jgi:hypothetical protein
MRFARRLRGLVLALAVIPVPAALADDLQPMDTSAVDPDLLKSFYGT